MCFSNNSAEIEVNFQLDSITVTEDIFQADFTLEISGGDPMMVLGSSTTISLTSVEGSASEIS